MNAIALPDSKQVEQQALAAVEQAKSISIVTDDDFQEAAGFLNGLKAIQKAIDETFNDPIKAAYAAHKSIVAAKAKHSEPVDQAERIIKGKLAAYQIEQERKARAEAERLALEARKKAEDEQLARAQAMEASGQKEAAEAILSEDTASPVIQARPTAKANGVSFREKWCGEVTDLMTLVKAIAVGQAPLTLIQSNPTTVRQYAESTKGNVKVPGVRFWVEKVVSGRSA